MFQSPPTNGFFMNFALARTVKFKEPVAVDSPRFDLLTPRLRAIHGANVRATSDPAQRSTQCQTCSWKWWAGP